MNITHMRQNLIRPAVTLALVSAIIGTTHAADPLAHYPFDSDLRDYSGNGNHGTMVDGDEGPLLTVLNNSGITNTLGEYQIGGGALNMTWDKDSVAIPVGTLAADGDGWAIAFWSRNAEVANNKGGMVIGNNTNITDHIHVDSGSGFRVRQSSGANATFGLTTGDTLWHHYAVVVEDRDSDGSFDDVTLYKDGVYVNTVLNAAGTGFSVTHIGDAYTNQFDFDFFGQIDEVYIYDQAITAAKVQELYGSAPDTTDPIVIEIINDRADGPVEPGSLVTYTA